MPPDVLIVFWRRDGREFPPQHANYFPPSCNLSHLVNDFVIGPGTLVYRLRIILLIVQDAVVVHQRFPLIICEIIAGRVEARRREVGVFIA